MDLRRSDSSSLPSTARKKNKPGTIWHLRKKLTRFAPKQRSRVRSSLRACPIRHSHADYCIGPGWPKPTAGLHLNRRNTMNRRNILSLSAIAALGLSALPGNAVAQTKSLKDQLVGMWTLVSETDITSG